MFIGSIYFVNVHVCARVYSCRQRTDEEVKLKQEQKLKKQEEERMKRMGSGLEEERSLKRRFQSADALDDE